MVQLIVFLSDLKYKILINRKWTIVLAFIFNIVLKFSEMQITVAVI